MARVTLVGDYGNYYSVVLGAEVTATTTLTAGTWYLITAVDSSSSGFPAAAEAGYLIRGDGAILLAGTDTAKPLTLTAQCDIQNWSLDFSKDEIEVTTLCDDQKVYIPGKSDVTGSATGVFKIGTTDVDDGIQNSFVDIVRASGTYDIDKINDSIKYVWLETQDLQTTGESQQFYFAPITFSTFGQGAVVGEQQTFESAFRIAPDGTNGVKFAYYNYTHS
jgi:hypothetical protein